MKSIDRKLEALRKRIEAERNPPVKPPTDGLTKVPKPTSTPSIWEVFGVKPPTKGTP